MQPYPKTISETIKSLADFCRVISRYREEDITDRNKFTSIFVGGRKVGKVPSASIDVAATDKLNDINWDADYLYILISDSGNPEWRRAALSSW